MKVFLGENIRILRKAKKMTQKEFACAIGVSYQTVSKWERGDTFPDITMLPIISDFFETTVDELLGIDKARRAKKAEEYIKMFDESTLKKREMVLREYETAIKEFPNDYRIVVRYMEILLDEKLHLYMDYMIRYNQTAWMIT